MALHKSKSLVGFGGMLSNLSDGVGGMNKFRCWRGQCTTQTARYCVGGLAHLKVLNDLGWFPLSGETVAVCLHGGQPSGLR